MRQQKTWHQSLGLLGPCKGLLSDPLLPGLWLAWEPGRGDRGDPPGSALSPGVRSRPGLVCSEVGSLDGDLCSGQEAGMVCLVMPPPSRCWDPAVPRLPSSWEL